MTNKTFTNQSQKYVFKEEDFTEELILLISSLLTLSCVQSRDSPPRVGSKKHQNKVIFVIFPPHASPHPVVMAPAPGPPEPTVPTVAGKTTYQVVSLGNW